ncbi:MAG TPA: HEAT repeat domain-containing protein [Chthonomonadaceae bacterium]|nr:HEAT repeat domain-containing protein [Chthonomonadaceae bacterium]
MKKQLGRNKHQKAAHKIGERHVSKEQVAELLEMSVSDNAEDRLAAAENLCPCHVRTRIPAVWEALYRMMQDSDPRVRQAAWHTIEDGGRPNDEAGERELERIYQAETHPKVKKFAELTLTKVLGPRRDKDMAALWLAGRPEIKQRGKCDFCGETDVFVTYERNTLIPAADTPRPALICEACTKR